MKRFKKYNKIDKHTTLDQEDYVFTELLDLVRGDDRVDPLEEPDDFSYNELICNCCGAQGDFQYQQVVTQYGSFSYVDRYGDIHGEEQSDTDYSGRIEVFCNTCSDGIDTIASFERTLEQWRIQYAKVVKAFSL